MRKHEKTKLGFANTNLFVHLQKNNREEILDDFLLLNDGLAIDIASLLLFGKVFPENLNGSDFVGKMLAALPKTARVFLFGSKPAVAEAAAGEIERQFGLKVCGYIDGYRSSSQWSIEDIVKARPDVVLVALGNPQQEMWIHDHANLIGAELFVGVGAWLDFFTKDKSRASALVRTFRLEWVHRMVHEPRRLWRRYTVDAMFFLLLIMVDAFRLRTRRWQKIS